MKGTTRKNNLKWMALLLAGGLFTGCAVNTSGGAQVGDTNVEAESTESKTEGTESETGEPETQTPPEPEVISVTMTTVGDCSFGPVQTHGYEGSLWEYYDQKGPAYFFDGVASAFEGDDFTVINLECVLTNETERVDKKWNIKGKPEYVDIMTSHSVEGCGLGNNHSSDYGPKSLTDTKEAVMGAGIGYAYNDELGRYTTESGISIGYVSVNLLAETKEREDYVENGIRKLREEGTDLVFALCHWGVESQYEATEYQRQMAHNCIDWGADLVIGAHPHVLQGMEMYKGKVICYSMGNFCFGGNSNPRDKRTMIFQQKFTFVDGVLQPETDAWVIPCMLSGHSDYNDYQPVIAEGEKKEEILNFLKEYSKDYGNLDFDGEGRLIMPTDSVSGDEE